MLTYGFHGSSIDREAGWARHSFSLPEPDSPHAQDPRLLIAVGGALEDYTLQGFRDGGCDPVGELDGVSAAVTRYESTLREVLNALCPSPDTLAHKYGGETDAASLSREVFFDTLCRGLGHGGAGRHDHAGGCVLLGQHTGAHLLYGGRPHDSRRGKRPGGGRPAQGGQL